MGIIGEKKNLPFGVLWGEWDISPLLRLNDIEEVFSEAINLNSYSNKKFVIVSTSSFDPHTDAVSIALEKVGVPCLRINTEEILNNFIFTWTNGLNVKKSVIKKRNSKRPFLFSEIISGYYRTPATVKPHMAISDSLGKSYAISEGSTFLESIYFHSGLRWISPPHLIRRAEAKLPQLQIAKFLGLQTPKTIVTNDPKKALLFAKQVKFNLITKPLNASSILQDERSFETFATKLSKVQFEENMELIKYAPVVLQEYINKLTEIRVTVIGNDVFPIEMDSQSIDEAKIDWRKVDPFAITCRPIKLPAKLISILRKFIKFYGMNFGVFDLIKTPDGSFFFLENNPNGQWYWLEILTGQKMAYSMAKLLAGSYFKKK